MPKLLCSALRYESGATAIEYALIGGMIGLVIIGGVTTVGDDLLALFQGLAGAL